MSPSGVVKDLLVHDHGRVSVATCKLTGAQVRWLTGNALVIRRLLQGVRSPQVVLKCYPKAALSPLRAIQVKREMAIHGNLRHPRIVTLYGAWEDQRCGTGILPAASPCRSV